MIISAMWRGAPCVVKQLVVDDNLSRQSLLKEAYHMR